jgi:hypothetical protein
MNVFSLHSGLSDEAAKLILKYHYSHRIPANVQQSFTYHISGGLFGDGGKAIAACLFSIPPTRWSEPVWELSRLVRIEDIQVSLTSFIAQCVRHIKSRHSINLLVSFADYTMNHHGGIYQAASWNYAGKRDKRMDGLIINGRFCPGRSCNSLWGTRSPSKLQSQKPDWKIEPHFDEGKFLYWKPLNHKGEQQAKRMGLDCLPYPKPGVEAVG